MREDDLFRLSVWSDISPFTGPSAHEYNEGCRGHGPQGQEMDKRQANDQDKRSCAAGSPTGMPGRRQHVVPAMHLQHFSVGSGRKGRLWLYDKGTSQSRQASVRNASVIGDYYTLVGLESPADIEQVLSVIESRAAPVLSRLIRLGQGPFDVTIWERYALAVYWATLNRRTPGMRNTLQDLIESKRNELFIESLEDANAFARYCRDHERTGSDEEIEAERLRWLGLWRSGRFRWCAPKILSLAGLAAAFKVAPLFASMRWILLRRSRSPFFVIGDSPAQILQLGPDQKESRWLMPLSAETLLVALPESGTDMVVDADGQDPTLTSAWKSMWAEAGVVDDAAVAYGMAMWHLAERWIFARARADLDAIRQTLHAGDLDVPASAITPRALRSLMHRG